MKRKIKLLALTLTLVLGLALNAQAFQAGAVGPVSLQNGFPIWWQDDAGVRVDLCTGGPGCVLDPVIPGNPFSEQIGFGAEGFWWMSNGTNANGVNLELAMEAAWLADPAAGEQFPFARVRLSGPVDVAGTWTIAGAGFNFTAVAADAGKGVVFKNQGVDASGAVTDVPPFSGILTASQITLFYGLGGNAALANITITGPGTAQTITPGDFVLAAGRLFDTGTNQAPIATDDTVATSVGAPVTINVVANDVDIRAAGNDHIINPLATGIGAVAPFILAPGVSAASTNGGTVMKNPDGTLTYTPPPTFVGTDTFNYVVQDTGGCLPGQPTLGAGPLVGTCDQSVAAVPAVVTVAVVNLTLTAADFRPKLMKWNLGGTAQGAADGQTLSIYPGATATGTPLGTATVAGGLWSFDAKSTTSPGAIHKISLALDTGVVGPAAAAGAAGAVMNLLDQPLTLR